MNRPCPDLRFQFQLPRWDKAGVLPFRGVYRVFIQDVGSKEDTEISREDLTLRWKELPVETLDTVSLLEEQLRVIASVLVLPWCRIARLSDKRLG